MPRNKLVIVDRDGTLNLDNGYEHRVENLVIIPEAIEFLVKASVFGFGVVIATNQGGVSLNKFSRSQSLKFNEQIATRLNSEGIQLSSAYICFHHPYAPQLDQRECLCRKPKSGMIEQILIDYDISKDRVLMVGDQQTDMDAAKSAGIAFQRIGDRRLWDEAAAKLEEF
jgi:D-glycero-D-manno-heptose 1,7-bisphosphate phosphatase